MWAQAAQLAGQQRADAAAGKNSLPRQVKAALRRGGSVKAVSDRVSKLILGQPDEKRVAALRQANRLVSKRYKSGRGTRIANETTRKVRNGERRQRQEGPEKPLALLHGLPTRGAKRQRSGRQTGGSINFAAVRRLARAARGKELVLANNRGAGLSQEQRQKLRDAGAKIADPISFKNLARETRKAGSRGEAVGRLADFIERRIEESGGDYVGIDELPSSFKDDKPKPGRNGRPPVKPLTRRDKLRTVNLLPAALEELHRREGKDQKVLLWGRFGAPPRASTVKRYSKLLQSASLRSRAVIYETYPSSGRAQNAVLPGELKPARGGGLSRGAREIELTARRFERAAPGVTTATLSGIGIFSSGLTEDNKRLPGAVTARGFSGQLRQLFAGARTGSVARLQRGVAAWSLSRHPGGQSQQNQILRILRSEFRRA